MTKNNYIVENIQSLLASDLTAYKIQAETGINRSTIGRLKKGEIEIVKLSLENALKLSDIWEEYKMEPTKINIIEEFTLSTDHTTNTGDHAYVLNELVYADGKRKFEVSYEIDGLADSTEPVYFETEEDARKHIEREMI